MTTEFIVTGINKMGVRVMIAGPWEDDEEAKTFAKQDPSCAHYSDVVPEVLDEENTRLYLLNDQRDK